MSFMNVASRMSAILFVKPSDRIGVWSIENCCVDLWAVCAPTTANCNVNKFRQLVCATDPATKWIKRSNDGITRATSSSKQPWETAFTADDSVFCVKARLLSGIWKHLYSSHTSQKGTKSKNGNDSCVVSQQVKRAHRQFLATPCYVQGFI